MAIEIGNNLTALEKKEKKFIGIKMPFLKSSGAEGYFESHTLTANAIKEDLVLLLNTDQGERLMQPNLGIGLKELLFENITEENIALVRKDVVQMVNTWMPFVKINDITVNMSDIEPNTMNISVNFSLEKDPNTQESVQITVGE